MTTVRGCQERGAQGLHVVLPKVSSLDTDQRSGRFRTVGCHQVIVLALDRELFDCASLAIPGPRPDLRNANEGPSARLAEAEPARRSLSSKLAALRLED